MKAMLSCLAVLACLAMSALSPAAAESAWYEEWGQNRTGVPTPSTNCAVYDPDMYRYLGDRAQEIDLDVVPYQCSTSTERRGVYVYKGHHEGSGNYWD